LIGSTNLIKSSKRVKPPISGFKEPCCCNAHVAALFAYALKIHQNMRPERESCAFKFTNLRLSEKHGRRQMIREKKFKRLRIPERNSQMRQHT